MVTMFIRSVCLSIEMIPFSKIITLLSDPRILVCIQITSMLQCPFAPFAPLAPFELPFPIPFAPLLPLPLLLPPVLFLPGAL
jgi:hypothetical protein